MSHVIGVVLLVVLAVMVAGVSAVYLAGFSESLGDDTPMFATTTTFDDRWTQNGQYLNITHESGATIETERLSLVVDDAERVTNPPSPDRAPVDVADDVIGSQVGAEFTSSETLVIDRTTFVEGGSPLSGSDQVDLHEAVVRIVYDHGAGERTEVIYECRPGVPDCEETPN